tara:strand:- start:139 stop:297 length:159 start_codon:yes stop_codon:yes gene_type:complete
MKRLKKHKEIKEDYQKTKSKHLEKLATKMLKHDEKNQSFKLYKMSGTFLNRF